MKRALDEALGQLGADLPKLLAVVLSAAPDGFISWGWSRTREASEVLAFAALHRTATLCLDSLDDEEAVQRLQLTGTSIWITSRPLHETEERRARAHLVLTTAFRGELRAGSAVMHSARVRDRVREIVDAHAAPERVELRGALADAVLATDEPVALMRELERELGVEAGRLAQPDALADDERRRLAASLARRDRSNVHRIR